jgi:penicillin-binding protein 1A
MQRIPRTAFVIVAVVAVSTSACAQMRNLPKLTAKDLRFHPAQSSKIYASDGRPITTLHGIQNRTVIPLQRIPKKLQHAVVAVEDKRFYQHSGVDVHAILRALAADLTSGHIEEGGSTITQQYVKNVIIAPGGAAPKTLERKIDEAALARQIERKLSKDEILERYLNTVYFGEGAYGVQAAARTYFGVDARKLTLAQAALIAGMIQSPAEFDPYRRPRAAKQRRRVVLTKMLQQRYIGPRRALEAGRSKLHLSRAPRSDRYPAPYFVDYVTRLIKFDPRFKMLGDDWKQREKRLFTGGLRIFTTVDLQDQKFAEEAAKYYLPYRSDPHAALVSIDPNTGHIKAMVGGRNYFATPKKDPFAKLNLATVAEPKLSRGGNRAPGSGRQAGSSFKPFALATAIKQGIPLNKLYEAAPCMDFPGADTSGNWHVCNYEGESFAGQITLLEATVLSVNVVYAQLILELGPEAVVQTAEDMGIRTHLLPVNSAVLGTNPVNVLDMASAYGTLATNGLHHAPVAITKILAPNGRVLYQDHSKPVRALEPSVAYLATTALEQVVQRGTGVNANIGRPQAGKTGTAQEWRDAWFIGYTPDLVTAVWVGYPEGEIEMKASCLGASSACRPTRITVQGGSWPAQIWARYMLRALSGIPAETFTPPAGGLVTVTIDSRNGCLAGRFTPVEDQVQATFAAGSAPTKSCREPGDAVTVPNVFGFPVEDAVKLLHHAGFEVLKKTQTSPAYPPGRVIGQTPEGGIKAPHGSTVTITVSDASSGSGSSGGHDGDGHGGGGGLGGGGGDHEHGGGHDGKPGGNG